jgi:hypothetical protein
MFTAFKELSAFGSQWLESSFSKKLNKDSAHFSELKSARPFSMTYDISIFVHSLLYRLIGITMDPVKAKVDYFRVCALLVNIERDALKAALHTVHQPSTLDALKKIRYIEINASQWNLLFPVSRTPDSKNFDATLLTILLRNISGLASPAAGWNVMPPTSDTSTSANIMRINIKIFKNEVYGHISNAQYDDNTFETLWQEITKLLVKLGMLQQYIHELKTVRVSFEEMGCTETTKEWTELEDKLFSVNFKSKDSVLPKTFENGNPSQIDQLTKFDFTRKIDDLSKQFHGGCTPFLAVILRPVSFTFSLPEQAKWTLYACAAKL